MVLEKPILPIFEWLSLNLPTFLATVLAVILLGMFIGFLAGALRHGPVESLRILTATVTSAIRDLIQLSPRRMFAIARLAFQESIRRRVLVVFAVFVIALSKDALARVEDLWLAQGKGGEKDGGQGEVCPLLLRAEGCGSGYGIRREGGQ